MIDVEIDSLSQIALDWAVANHEGLTVRRDPMGFKTGSEAGYWVWDDVKVQKPTFLLIGRGYSPTTLWEQGGPILERLREMAGHQFLIESDGPNVHVLAWPDEHTFYRGYGSTLLVAAMRCYVASKAGETIKVPESLIG